jgi:crossover junction endodeoxyribonuclease RuvC
MAAAQEVTILGVDPGLQQTGLGMIAVKNQDCQLVESAILRTDAERHNLAGRLAELFEGMQQTLRRWRPQFVVVEKLIYARNAQVALALGHARGVLLLAAMQEQVPIAEYTPAEVKRAVTGSGAASKEQVYRMVKALLQSPQFNAPYDVTDALALAICHAHRLSAHGRAPKGVKSSTRLARA